MPSKYYGRCVWGCIRFIVVFYFCILLFIHFTCLAVTLEVSLIPFHATQRVAMCCGGPNTRMYKWIQGGAR